MTPAEQAQLDDYRIHRALLDCFVSFGMHVQDGCLSAITSKLVELGVKLSVSPEGFLEMTQQGTQIAPSSMAVRIRRELPLLFASDPKFDSIASLEDFKGTPTEILKAKTEYIKKFGPESLAALPKTRKQAETNNAPVNADMTAAQWKALDWKERSRLTGIFDEGTLRKIMVRK